MKHFHHISTIITLGLVSTLLWGGSFCGADERSKLKVTLQDHVQTTDGVLQIKDVAKLDGLPQADLKRWEELDLLDGSEKSPDGLRITRSLITARLLLAGCPVEMITFSGAAITTVERVERRDQNDLEVERLAQREISRQLGLNHEQVEVRLMAPCVERLKIARGEEMRGELDVIPPTSRTNDPHITVRWIEAGVVKSTLSCGVRIRVSRDWPTAVRDLSMGQILSDTDIVTRPVWCPWTEIAPPVDQCVGKQLKRPLGSQSKVLLSDLANAAPTANQAATAPVIKPRDLIRVSAVRGNLTVVLPSAEALQAGRPGERIRLRNLESQRVIIGTVIAAGEVEIQLR